MRHLPSGWEYSTIEELITKDGLFCDGDWVESKDQDPAGSVRLIQLADIGDGEFRDKSSRYLTAEKAKELSCSFLKKGDILVARMPDPLGRACIFPLEGERKFVTVVDVCVVRSGSNSISSKFLVFLINSPNARKEIESYQSGSTRKRISRKNFAAIHFPLPPLNEQHRIVAKIEELFSELEKGVESLKTAREQLKVYRQSVLKAAFEGRLTESWRAEHSGELESAEQLLARIKAEREARYAARLAEWQQSVESWEAADKPGKKPNKPKKPKELPPLTADELAGLPQLPEGWAVNRVGNLLDVVSGNTPKGISNISGGDLPYYRVSDMNRAGNEKWMDASETNITKSEARQMRLGFYPRGTVIFPKRGGAILTNKKRLLSKDASFDLNTMGVVNQLPSIEQMYVWWWFVKLDLSKIYDGSNVPQINNKNIEPLSFPICSLAEQHKIVQEIELRFSVVEKMEKTIEESLQKAEALRQSILKRAFEGKLVPQDPRDEPASALLERIRADRVAAPVPKRGRKKI